MTARDDEGPSDCEWLGHQDVEEAVEGSFMYCYCHACGAEWEEEL